MSFGLARFPFVRDLVSFDFGAHPSIDKAQVREIASGRFIANGEAVCATSQKPPDSRIGAGVIQAGKLRRFAMGQAIAVRQDFTSAALRRLAAGTKDVAQARRLLAIAAVLDGASRAEAARMAEWTARRCGTG